MDIYPLIVTFTVIVGLALRADSKRQLIFLIVSVIANTINDAVLIVR